MATTLLRPRQKRRDWNLLRISRHDHHEVVGIGKDGTFTRLDDAKRGTLLRSDILLLNAPNGQQFCAYPRKDGTLLLPSSMRPFLTADDIAWAENEAKLVAAHWGQHPELARLLH